MCAWDRVWEREEREAACSVQTASLQELVGSLVGFINTSFIHVSLNKRRDNISEN